MLIVCVVGMPASGKGVVVEEARKMGFPVIVMGDVVREETVKRGLPLTPRNLNMVAQDLRSKEGEDAVAKRCVKKIKKLKTNVVIVDGVRSLKEIECYRRELGKTVIIAVHASPKTRFERILKRNRPGDPKNWSEFVERDMVELGFGLGSVIALADYMIVNEGSIEELKRNAHEVFGKVLATEGV
ncbi:MAG: dephospho-CoA kinase [Thermoprotei archaeon]|nr:MAG: dephospho-CoA kinase [Thermoprotei archaeon]